MTEEKGGINLLFIAAAAAFLAIGVYYFMYMNPKDGNFVTDSYTNQSPDTNSNTTSNSDEVSDIEADLNSTNLDTLDQGMANIESEL